MNNKPSRTKQNQSIPFYRDERVLRNIAQAASAIAVLGIIYFAAANFFRAADARGLSLGFGFLKEASGFPISEAHIEYDPTMSFGRAFLTGLVNTLLVSGFGVVAATILGTIVALARLSSNWLLKKIALVFVEFHRNIPLLVLLYLWYFTVFQQLPNVQDSLIFGENLAILNQRGLYLTWPRAAENGYLFLGVAGAGLITAIILFVRLRKRREISGKETYFGSISLAVFFGSVLIAWLLTRGSAFTLDIPELVGFNYRGGLRVTPEFAGLLVGLVTYTAGFIAEVVRAGIQAVDRGQVEAAQAVGLNYFQVLSLIVMPQALRIIIPPMISQYLNLTKNSSLALIIGFQDVFGVSKIAINNAGRAVPVFAMVMATYLALSLITSLVLNLYNRRIQLVTR